jgi:hypothetical protein
LILWNNDLAGIGIIGVLDRVAENADNSDHLAHFFYPIFDIAGVTDELLTASNLIKHLKGHYKEGVNTSHVHGLEDLILI